MNTLQAQCLAAEVVKDEFDEKVWPDEYVCVDVIEIVGDCGTLGTDGGFCISHSSENGDCGGGAAYDGPGTWP